MTDFDYPPSRTYEFGAALEDVEQRLADTEERVDELEAQAADEEDPDVQGLQEAYQELTTASNYRDALDWAVREWGEAAEITLQAFTAKTRADVLDTIQRTRVGHVGPEQRRNWLVAAGVQAAPFVDESDDVETKAGIVEQLPPALTDWIDEEIEDLNDLTAGN